MNSLVAVTGGAGFLGMHLASILVERGASVRIMDTAQRPAWADEVNVEFVEGDVRDVDALARLVDGTDTIIHAAFASPAASLSTIRSVNVEGTEIVCRAATQAGTRLVMVSSTIVSRPLRPHPLLRHASASRLCSYKATRMAAEDVAKRHASAGLAVAVVRPKTLVGPGRLGGFALVFDAIRRGGRVPLVGRGQNRYQVIDVGDLAAGLSMLACAEQSPTGTFYFGAHDPGTVAEDLGAVVRHAGTGARLQYLSGPLARVGIRGLELAAMAPLAEWHHCGARGRDSIVDTSRVRAEMGWEARNSNAEALIGAYDWYVAAQAAGPLTTNHPIPASHRLLHRLTRGR